MNTFTLSPLQTRNHEIRKAGQYVCRWQGERTEYSLWKTPRNVVEGEADHHADPYVLVIDGDGGVLHTEVLLDSAYGCIPESLPLTLAKEAQDAAERSQHAQGSAIISRYVHALALDDTLETYAQNLVKAKELALLEIRAEGPVDAPTVQGWLDEQGSEAVARLAYEAIQDLLDANIIEVWDPEEEIPLYGYVMPHRRAELSRS